MLKVVADCSLAHTLHSLVYSPLIGDSGKSRTFSLFHRVAWSRMHVYVYKLAISRERMSPVV